MNIGLVRPFVAVIALAGIGSTATQLAPGTAPQALPSAVSGREEANAASLPSFTFVDFALVGRAYAPGWMRGYSVRTAGSRFVNVVLAITNATTVNWMLVAPSFEGACFYAAETATGDSWTPVTCTWCGTPSIEVVVPPGQTNLVQIPLPAGDAPVRFKVALKRDQRSDPVTITTGSIRFDTASK